MSVGIQSFKFIGDGATTLFSTGAQLANTTNILAIVNGLVQLPDTDYSVTDGDITFFNVPHNLSDIEIRYYTSTDVGYQGSTGEQGPIGQTGYFGSDGFIGPPGYQGSVGYRGSAGEPGGPTGYTGSAGAGYSGSIGYSGSKGFDGSRGFTGSAGAGYTGSAGAFAPRASQVLVATNTSTYTLDEVVENENEIFVIVNGLVQIPNVDYTVTETTITFISNIPIVGSDIEIRYFGASQGQLGYTGSVGYRGSVGGIGPTGFRGSAGEQGPQGNPGGQTGFTGSRGASGTNGDTGYTGSRGNDGLAGAPRNVEFFVGNGSQTQFQSSYSIPNSKSIFVMVNGLVQMPDVDYQIAATDKVEFISVTPGINSDIEIRHFDYVGYAGSRGETGYRGSSGFRGSAGDAGPQGPQGPQGDPGGSQGYTGSRGTSGFTGSRGYSGSEGRPGSPKSNQTYVADGATSSFALNSLVYNTKSIFVMVNGLVLVPDADYSITNNDTLVLNDMPNDLADIEIRYFDDVGYQGSVGQTGYRGSVGYTGSNGFAMVYMSPTPPPSPDDGALWWDTDNGILNIFYEDENTWVGIAEGPRGPRGYAGSTGIGYTGSRGIPGEAAAVGYTGSLGNVGYTGSVGSIGYSGSQGIAGEYAAIGFTGSIGSVGYTGSAGSIGYSGSQGIAGEYAAIGFTGSSGIVGYTGSSGTVGYTGSIGVGYTGSAGSGSGGTSLGSRRTFSQTVTVPTGDTSNYNIQAYKGYAIYKIQVNSAAWVRVYSNSDSRTSDATRSITDEPNYNSGVIAEIVTDAPRTVSFTPAAIGFNDEDPVTNVIPLAVTNRSGSSGPITVILTLIPLESE